MNRIEFLQRFLGSGLLLTSPNIIAKTEPIAHKEILLYEGFVAGFVHYKGNDLLHQMKHSDALDLVREPENAYDEKAIAVYWQGEKIGFMPQLDNKVLAAILDAALPCTAHIAAIYPKNPNWEKMLFGITLHFPMVEMGEV